MRLLVGQILLHITDGKVDSEKLAKQAQGAVGQKDVSAVVAALHFVLTSAGAERATLSNSSSARTRLSFAPHLVRAAQPSTRWMSWCL